MPNRASTSAALLPRVGRLTGVLPLLRWIRLRTGIGALRRILARLLVRRLLIRIWLRIRSWLLIGLRIATYCRRLLEKREVGVHAARREGCYYRQIEAKRWASANTKRLEFLARDAAQIGRASC